jgi:hypothetical protein|tara:strand:+ start:819 stop:1268 length:450 start_codon:yes stop_codon:yes gene_type:complete
MRKRYKGKYKIKNPNKYLGNPTNIIYRSLMERRFMEWCDSNDKCYKWSSEEVVIPYISPIDNKQHRYFPDFLIQTPKGWFLIEVKPLTQSRPPKKLVVENLELKKKRRYIKSVQTWLVNEAKWKAATKVCEKKGWSFQILTEKQLVPDK